MNNEKIIFLYAKIGYFFAGCDGSILDEEDAAIKTKIKSLLKKDKQLNISDEELLKKLDEIKSSNIKFEALVNETKNVLSEMNLNARIDLLNKLNSFIAAIIYADDTAQEIEKKYSDEWNSIFKKEIEKLDSDAADFLLKEEILLLYAKTGYFFAKCDASLKDEEDNSIKTKLQNLIKQNDYKNLNYSDINKKIELIRNSDIDFDSIKNETKKVLCKLDGKDSEELIEKLRSFINQIIYADDQTSENERDYFKKWEDFVNFLLNKRNDNNKKSGKLFIVIIIILFVFILAVIGLSIWQNAERSKMRTKLQEIPISKYTEKALQFKEIDFSKVLIYGTNSDAPEKDSMLIYFVKGSANIRLTNLDLIEIDMENTNYTKKDLHIIYHLPMNTNALPIDVDVVFDENKCRLIENINAKPMSEGKSGKIFKTVTTVVTGAAGAVAGNKIGGLFGIKGQIIGTAAGATLASAGSYIFTSNFCKKTSLVKENNAETIVDLFEEAKPVIAAQLLYDDYTSSCNVDKVSQKDYYQQKIADLLSEIILSGESSSWEKVSVRFVTEYNSEAK